MNFTPPRLSGMPAMSDDADARFGVGKSSTRYTACVASAVRDGIVTGRVKPSITLAVQFCILFSCTPGADAPRSTVDERTKQSYMRKLEECSYTDPRRGFVYHPQLCPGEMLFRVSRLCSPVSS